MRRSGRSTRLVDEAVQKFFIEGKVLCKDHYDDNVNEISKAMQKRVVSRLQFEHGLREGKDFRRGFNLIEGFFEIINLRG